jgi:signal transduction histidine kinase
MPGMDGFELAELMRGTERTRRVPIIFLTAGTTDWQRRFRGYEAGAVDFLWKPIEPDILKSKADVFYQLACQRQELLQQRDELKLATEENARLLMESRQYAEALKEADQRKDEFLATLAHELRNPLAPLRTGLQILKIRPGGQESEQARDMMERQLSHMVRLIDDLLDVSRVSSGKLVLKREPVTAQAVVLSAIEASRSFIEAAGHEFELHLPDEALYLDADPTRLAQVVGNLLTNAAKYTPSGGKICLHVRRDADQVVVEVTDTGEGIPAEMIPKVFELFTQVGHTLDRSQGGLGIGLALVKQLVDMHGGTVTAVSRGAGQGSTFSVRLPLDRVRQSPGPNVDALEMETGFPRRRVLVVDDNVDAAESLSMVLKLDGHEVRAAHSGEEAMLLAKEFHPEIAFLDIGLPGLNGYDLARMIRGADELKDVVLVALTGWGSDEDKQKSKAAGFDYHLTKPIETSMMQEVLGQPR